jgi:predicted nucleotide-binding protein
MAGSHKLAWPEDHEQCLGMTLLLIEKLASDEHYVLSFAFQYFHSGSKIIAGIHTLTGQVLVPFYRDYKAYVMSQADTRPRRANTDSKKVFIVHGHDDAALQGLARFIERLGLTPIVLKEQPNQGRTIIEKYEECAGEVGYAIVLLTPDDIGSAVADSATSARARQNVIFELGYFVGMLGRGRVCLLRKGDVEMPSDLFGIVYTDLDSAEGWKHRLVAELKAAKIDFDANRMWA